MLRVSILSLILAWGITADVASAQNLPPSAQSLPPSAVPNHLEPGDIVRLRIWREVDMSGEFRVDSERMVVFPRLGPWPVGGKDVAVLKTELFDAYARYLRTPSIELTFLRRINVGGAVQKPGVYHIDPTMTIRDALLEAGGPTPIGRNDRVELIRDGNRIQARLRQDLRIIESPIRSGDQLYIPERTWLSRNIHAAVGIGSALLGFAATMILIAASN